MRSGLFFNPQENRVFVSTNATFLEEDHVRDHKPRSKLVLNEATDKSIRVVDEVGPLSRVDETNTSDDGVEDPLSYKQAMNDIDKHQWVKAMDLEMESIYFNSVLELVDLPEEVNSKKDLLPFKHRIHLSKEQCPKTPQEVKDMRRIPFASAVGSLMYTMPDTRPENCYEVDLILIEYTDSNFQTNKDSSKSTSRSVFTLNKGVVVWRSIKEGCITDSTMELYGAVANSKEPHSHKRGKHIERKPHLIWEIVE
ncbi:gag/pol protein [Cucumis melo var. makuwa]|uniref:Gag/pol protein n=1 Tax=Cucumis melo var. makuwa TaxID=1194695 RepID=A0A5D3DUG4_CUCMM|nr:gag/pol protein [Cucumis melo var. makuwa]TYK27331.1 gag/pol protein [Cucumis melo var. makuwa]